MHPVKFYAVHVQYIVTCTACKCCHFLYNIKHITAKFYNVYCQIRFSHSE